ncbi:MAG: 2-amino-4-hydroxy-6-hydroxymethyldihydropteridine diphosphokinase [Nitrospirae bacterium]|nr:MAG: 2-amino-4-hydroxy-6-hydroxymethyldihydropteridine diphosphokinase [Nitrospirota bacterium]
MPIFYIGLGSNVGGRERNCEKAVSILKERGVSILKMSSLYETPPWGVEDQPDFINMVVEAEAELRPLELLNLLKEIESDMGRVKTYRWGPRLIDLDILFYDTLVVDTPELKIPHPYIEKREFVLRPLSEIAPGLRHPVTGKTVREMLESLEAQA